MKQEDITRIKVSYNTFDKNGQEKIRMAQKP